jgi:predicted secreted hydrolase
VPAFPDQELIINRSTRMPYWEGAVDTTGKFGKAPIKGAGYLGMTLRGET